MFRSNRAQVTLFIGACVLVFLRIFPHLAINPFLTDQVDMLAQADALFRGKLQALYGPVMSGSSPLVYNFGPLGPFLFGVGSWISREPRMLHAFFLCLCGLAFAWLWRELIAWNHRFAWLWIAALILCPPQWLLLNLIWVNTLLVVLTSVATAMLVRFQRAPAWSTTILFTASVLFGLHVHLTASVYLPLVFWMWWSSGKQLTWSSFRLRERLCTIAMLCLCLGPYLRAEMSTGFANTQAVFANSGQHRDVPMKLSAAWGWLSTWTELLGVMPYAQAATALSFLGLGLAIFLAAAREPKGSRFFPNGVRFFSKLWLVVVAWQFAFFFATGRPIASPHYLAWSSPVMLWPIIYLLWAAGEAMSLHARRGVVFTTVLIGSWVALFFNMDENPGRSSWNFHAIERGLQEVCAVFPTIRSSESGHFVPYRNYDMTVLKYVVRYGETGCSWNESATVVLSPSIATHQPTIVLDSKIFVLERVVKPGIGVYSAKDL